MAKIKVSFRIKELELNIEGERSNVPEVTQALQRQFGALLNAPAAVADSSFQPTTERVITPAVELTPPRKPKRRTQTAPKNSGSAEEAAIDFKHDPAKWGNPRQSWTSAQKAAWLLYVVKNQQGINELSGISVTETFNKHFRQSGMIKTHNVNRDLGKYKSKTPPWVGEDATKTPPTWFLTDEGEKEARKLVAEATGTANTNGA